MRTAWLIAVAFLGVIAGCQASRFREAMLEVVQDEGPSSSLWKMMRDDRGGGGSRRKEIEAAYATIKFIVPPAEAKDFEKEWMNLADIVDKDEDVDHFTLFKHIMDNSEYHSYGEWASMRDLRDHFYSKHFKDFSDYVDNKDIKWELRFLDNFSEDIDKKQSKKREQLGFFRGNTHVLTSYYVPPGEGEGFIDAWTDTAEKTIDEKGNFRYNLRKVSTDNTHFWVLGAWDSMDDFMDHFESKHLGRLHEYAMDKDIYYNHHCLEMVGEKKGQK